MKYEDMSLSQLKSLCRDRGLGTGRSKQELINKLVAYDNRGPEVDDTDLTEDQIDDMMEKGEPVVTETSEAKRDDSPEDEDPSPTVFRISFSHSGPLLDTEHEAFRRQTWELARDAGYIPIGGPTVPRLVGSGDGHLHYEIEVHG